MPRLRDVSFTKVIKLLKHIGYVKDRQESSHITMKAADFRSRTGENIITVPAHNPLVIKTLTKILKDASNQTGIPEEQLKSMLEKI